MYTLAPSAPVSGAPPPSIEPYSLKLGLTVNSSLSRSVNAAVARFIVASGSYRVMMDTGSV